MIQDHTVTVDSTAVPSTIHFAPVFNVAVPFIDRHLEEGRASKAVIRTVAGEVTYGELAERANRCGNLLLSLGAAPGDRVLMVVKDCPEFFYLFWGAIKAGIVPVPVNTLLRAPDYQYMIEDSGCTVVVYSPEFTPEIAPALAAVHPQPTALLTEGDATALQARLQQASPVSGSIPPARLDGLREPYTGIVTSL
jgi:acyl-coenzyme A synthetase/AMP-(fatty) acid ligase